MASSSTARPPDLFSLLARELPPDVVRGLELLASSPPLWPIGKAAWLSVVDHVKAFACRWDGQARACGWPDLELYALQAGRAVREPGGHGRGVPVRSRRLSRNGNHGRRD